MNILVKSLVLLFTTFFISSCWAVALLLQDAFHSVDEIEASPPNFPDAKINEAYDHSIKVYYPEFLTLPSARIVKGKLPVGMKLEFQDLESSESEVAPTKGKPLRLYGIPMEAGEYEFKIRAECCGTMSGPAYRDKGNFSLTVKE